MINQHLWAQFCRHLSVTEQLYFIIDRDPDTKQIAKVTINNKENMTIFEWLPEHLNVSNELLFVIIIRQTLEVALERRKFKLELLAAQDMHGRGLHKVFQRIAGNPYTEADEEFALLRRLTFSVSLFPKAPGRKP